MRIQPNTPLKTPQKPSFSGYRPHPEAPGHAQIYHPDAISAKTVSVTIREPQGNNTQADTEKTYALEQTPDKRQWVLKTPVKAGSHYALMIDGKRHLDALHTQLLTSDSVSRAGAGAIASQALPFNVIDNPIRPALLRSPGSMLDIFQHSLRQSGNGSAGTPGTRITTHFNQKQGSVGKALNTLLKQPNMDAAKTVLLKPFSQGGYWIENPYQLDPQSFANEPEFDAFLDTLLANNQQPAMDLALVNQNMTGGQYQANLIHGARSPFWEWFRDNQAERSLESPLPRVLQEGFKHGILPTKYDPSTGHRDQIDYERFQVHLSNAPSQSNYQPLQQTWLKITPTPLSDDHAYGPEDSVHPYEFPVDANLAQEKLAEAQARGLKPNDEAYKRLMLDWPATRSEGGARPAQTIDAQCRDDALAKWNGNVDVPSLNPDNPQVRAYLQGAVTHWVARVVNHQRAALAQQLPNDLTPATLLAFEQQRFKGLPVLPDAALNQALTPPKPQGEPAQVLTQKLTHQYALSALPLPRTLNHWLSAVSLPEFNKGLQNTAPGGWFAGEGFAHALQNKLEAATRQLPQPEQAKLSSDLVQLVILQKLAPKLYLQLLTGSPDANGAGERLLKHLPQVVLKSDPVTVARLLPETLTRQLNELPPETVAHWLTEALEPLDPVKLSVADALINHHELGPNLRLDAAKDVADFDPVYAAPTPEAREKALDKSMQHVVGFWNELLAPAKAIYPALRIGAEVTDIHLLGDGKPELMKKSYETLMQAFDSMPEMDHGFSKLHELVHYAQRPFEAGNSQVEPFEGNAKANFWNELSARAHKIPLKTQHNYQTLGSSHDYATVTHNLLHNPLLFFANDEPYRGVKDEFSDARLELSSKAVFEPVRAQLKQAGIENPGDALYKLEQHLAKVNNPLVQGVLDGKAKEASNMLGPTPRDLKAASLKAVAQVASAQALGLPNDDAKAALIQAYERVLLEPSAAKAKRAVLNNALVSYFKANKTPEAQQQQLFKAILDASLPENANDSRASQRFGYLPLEAAWDQVLKRLPQTFALNGLRGADLKQALMTRTLQTTQLPQKFERLVAMQVALPGQPSVYLHDLFAPSGGETDNNAFVQNRNEIFVTTGRGDTPAQTQMKQKTLALLALRKTLPVLNDGLVRDVAPEKAQQVALNQAGVMPIVRDNGRDQAIVLINTGKPAAIDWSNRVGGLETYGHPSATQPVARNFKLDLSALDMPVGTQYQSIDSGERYELNAQHQLVHSKTKQGIDIETVKALKRL
ncbi:MAG: hypothetical protein VKJ06_03755 [Vampirovibrionales bacterium]|nr:hypothetical protein [Vampirovibrionales bacterium]